MTDMIERVARALCEAASMNPNNWPHKVGAARAAIEAMMEPTDSMKSVGFEKWRATSIRSDTSQGADIYRAMLSEALAPSNPMTGFLATLTPEQRERALVPFDGDETLGEERT